MGSEHGLDINHEKLNELLTKADVLTIGFTLVPERLLVDFRSNNEHGQFAALVEPVANVQERYHWLGQRRGGLGAPEAFSFFVWPKSVRTMVEREVLAPMQRRLSLDVNEQLESALADFAHREDLAIAEAVRGDTARWQTLWAAS